jgi:two-component system chemotaxis response regulator CheY
MGTILIADDDRLNQRLLTFTLQKNGQGVVTAGHGLEALQCLAENTVDLIITDIEMPEMDGITLLRHLRADPRFRTLPAIVLTASGDDEMYSTAYAAGANGILTKPASSWELTETVQKLLGKQSTFK